MFRFSIVLVLHMVLGGSGMIHHLHSYWIIFSISELSGVCRIDKWDESAQPRSGVSPRSLVATWLVTNMLNSIMKGTHYIYCVQCVHCTHGIHGMQHIEECIHCIHCHIVLVVYMVDIAYMLYIVDVECLHCTHCHRVVKNGKSM